MRKIAVPKPQENSSIDIEFEKNIVIVGANGAGKTRLGSNLEQNNNPTKRISAQRYLQINEAVPRSDFETANNQLKSGYKNQPAIQPQNDFQQVLVSLFAQESERDAVFVKLYRTAHTTAKKPEVPQSFKEKVSEVWDFIFPYRPLRLEKDKVRAVSDDNEFSGTEMSDGEKVGLYLISQVILAEDNCILIIDEPELHLHKALMVRLWNKLEEFRSDCIFIYITHDLDFAVSKPTSKILWIKSYKNNIWEWKEVDQNEIVPDDLFLEILGSRKPILFVEGEKGSLDSQLYQSYYEDFTVIPRGSSEKVIESVKGLKRNTQLHDKKVYGLIDRDFRPSEQITSLQSEGIFSILLNEIENLFLIPDIIQIVCEYLNKTDKQEAVISKIREVYKTNKALVEFSASKYKIFRIFGEKFGSVKSKEDYDNFKKNIISEMDNQIGNLTLPVETADIVEILTVYQHKGLVKDIQLELELSRNDYQNLVLSFLTSKDKKQKVVEVFSKYLPKIKEN